MAEDTKELLEEVKSLLNGFKEVGSYAANLRQAMAGMAQPLQQMSDFSKAIAENMAKASVDAESFKNSGSVNKVDMAEALALFTEIAKKQEKSYELDIKRKEEAIKIKEIDKERHESWVEMDRLNKERAEQQRLELEMVKESATFWDKLKQSSHDFADNLAKAGNIRIAQGVRTGSQVMLGNADLGGAMSSVAGQLSQLAPTAAVGGLIGMMLHGRMEDAKFAAVGQVAAQQFDAIGGAGKKFAGDMAGLSRTLSVYGMGAALDVAAVTASFASLGVKASEAQAKVQGFTGILKGDLIEATLAADKAFEMSAGSMAKMSSTMARDFNISAKEAFINLMNIGTAAERAGQNATVFMQQTMEAASSLRLLNANMDAVSQTQLNMTNSMRDRGVNDQFAGSYAASGTQSAMQGISGMSVGLSAIIGERLGFGSGLDAWYSMKSGSGASARGDKQLDTIAIMQEMRGIVGGLSSNRAEQAYALQGLFGVDTAGADTILDIMEEVNSSGEISAESQKKLNEAFKTESQKTNQLLLDIKIIQDGFAHLSSGLMTLMVSGIKSVFDMIASLYYLFKSFTETDEKAKAGYFAKSYGYAELAEDQQRYSDAGMKNINLGIDEITKGTGKAWGDLGLGESKTNKANQARFYINSGNELLNRASHGDHSDPNSGLKSQAAGVINAASGGVAPGSAIVDAGGFVFELLFKGKNTGKTFNNGSGGK